MTTRTALVELADIQSAVSALEHDAELGRISTTEASERINDSKKAVTPRDLWKASGGRAGTNKRSDWQDIRRTAFGAVFLLVLAAVGVWIVTIYTGKAVGSEDDYIREPTPSAPSVSVPADQPPDGPGGG